jgi:hypothetical protein
MERICRQIEKKEDILKGGAVRQISLVYHRLVLLLVYMG